MSFILSENTFVRTKKTPFYLRFKSLMNKITKTALISGCHFHILYTMSDVYNVLWFF